MWVFSAVGILLKLFPNKIGFTAARIEVVFAGKRLKLLSAFGKPSIVTSVKMFLLESNGIALHLQITCDVSFFPVITGDTRHAFITWDAGHAHRGRKISNIWPSHVASVPQQWLCSERKETKKKKKCSYFCAHLRKCNQLRREGGSYINDLSVVDA